MFKFLLLSALMFFIGYGVFSFFTKLFRGPRQNYNSNQRRNTQNNRGNYSSSQQDKRYSKDVGEYVNYEEIKDDDNK